MTVRGITVKSGSIHRLPIAVTRSSCLQNVQTDGSEFPYWCAYSHIKFVFINANICVESGVRDFQALFCAYAAVTNEAIGQQASHLLGVRLCYFIYLALHILHHAIHHTVYFSPLIILNSAPVFLHRHFCFSFQTPAPSQLTQYLIN